MPTDERTDKEKIEAGEWVECRICRDVFKRQTMTKRYCRHCKHAFCEGNHGTFEGKHGGICVKCYNLP